MELSDINNLIENGEIEKAEQSLNFYLGEKDVNYWLLKGSVNQKKQLWGQAINAFQKVLEIDPANKEALTRLEMIKSIMNFWNPEMFNV